ncbi:DUF1818 family protein [Pseudanabaena sp. FACHB-1277]|uniref:DUF1818 family protein n=1 Tax=Pseudanabaena cinerea FACHB-1277 TaxID=2949581 RepID=A0A926UXZ3_9CYAN|nr:DUF1818 family protein [Pseudanabaena cinerea]MBD2152215.1 DUF1818 family protein [Pseudanabaena cinerea FACHB-1277]
MLNFIDQNSSKQLLSGEGWRVGFRGDVDVYKGLVGADSWAIELTESEFKDFCKLTLQLVDTMRVMAIELSDGEKICCTLETEDICLEVNGYPHAFNLHFQLLTGRRSEGFWDEMAVPHLITAIGFFKT